MDLERNRMCPFPSFPWKSSACHMHGHCSWTEDWSFARNMNHPLTSKINLELTESNSESCARNRQRSTRIFHAKHTWNCSFQNHGNFFSVVLCGLFFLFIFFFILKNYNTRLYDCKDHMTARNLYVAQTKWVWTISLDCPEYFILQNLLVWVLFLGIMGLKTNQLTYSEEDTKTQTRIFWEENLTRNKVVAGCVFQHHITKSFTLFFQNTSSLFISCSTVKL